MSKLPCLRYCVYKVFTIWPLLTPNDLWPPPKTIGFLYLMWYTYILNMRSVQASLLEISCLQGFHNLTLVDPKWPLTSIKNNRLLVLNVIHIHTKYEICPSSPSWDIVFTSWASHHTHTYTHTHIQARGPKRGRLCILCNRGRRNLDISRCYIERQWHVLGQQTSKKFERMV